LHKRWTLSGKTHQQRCRLFKRAFNTIQELILKTIFLWTWHRKWWFDYYPFEMCFADNNLGAKIDFCFWRERHHQISICREYRNCISGKRRCCMESKLNANNVAFQNGNCYYRSDFRPRH
jgi:phosphoribosylformylglycinamidine synthase